MAVIGAEGYATEAARLLLSRADKNRQYQIFVFHDADPHGYNIARTLREETRRMPGYQVDVIDLGLYVKEALDLGLQTERFTRKQALPQGLKLTELERQYFVGRQDGKETWICERVEINALPVRERAPYLERKLREAGAVEKVIPPQEQLPALVKEMYREAIDNWVRNALERVFSASTLTRLLAEEFEDQVALDKAQIWIEEAFAQDESSSWRRALKETLQAVVTDRNKELEGALLREIRRVRGA